MFLLADAQTIGPTAIGGGGSTDADPDTEESSETAGGRDNVQQTRATGRENYANNPSRELENRMRHIQQHLYRPSREERDWAF